MQIQLQIFDEKQIEMKLKTVEEILKDKKVIVAFSGGVDSSVLAYLSKMYAKMTLLVMQVGLSIGIGEKENAIEQAKQLDLPLIFLEYNEIDISNEYTANPSNRCYFCKNILHKKLNEVKKDYNYDLILSGTNYSDMQGHRPGQKAIVESGAISPLLEGKLVKEEIRWIARTANLKSWNKPASACLASRIQTGITITSERLERVGKAEYFLKSRYNFQILRVRDHGDLARIEIGVDEISSILNKSILSEINKELKGLGYKYVTIDLEGYRPSGSKS